jgi:hypothetical protein
MAQDLTTDYLATAGEQDIATTMTIGTTAYSGIQTIVSRRSITSTLSFRHGTHIRSSQAI